MMRFILIVSFSLFLSGCHQSDTPQPEPTRERTITLGDEPKARGEDLPDAIKIRVQISSADDLRVKAGQKIRRGDVIADRRRERELLGKQIVRLREQREAILLSVKRLDYLSQTNQANLQSIEKQTIDLEQQLARVEVVRASFAGTVEKNNLGESNQ